MTDRERWTVYPLLFLTLGVAMRDKIFNIVEVDKVQCKSVLCNALVVTDQKGKQQVVVSSNQAGGIVQTVGNDGRPSAIVGHTQQISGLLFVDAQGKVLAESIAAPRTVVPNPQAGGTGGDKSDNSSESGEP